MAYGESGIPHHEIAGLGGAHERHMRSAGGRRGGVGHGMSNANNGGGHSMSKGGSWWASVKSKVTSDKEGRKEGRKEPTH